MTFREYCLRSLAYERLEIAKLQVVRWLGYRIMEPYMPKKGNISIYDILPLPGDPTKEELKAKAKKEMQESIDGYHKVKEKYAALGLITLKEPK